MDYGDESYHDPISTEMVEDICDGSQSHPNLNRIEARYKKCDHNKHRKLEWKGELKDTRNTGKGLQKVFKTVVKEISQYLPPLGESVLELSHLIPEPRKFAEVKKCQTTLRNLG